MRSFLQILEEVVSTPESGSHDLEKTFKELNTKYFDGKLEPVKLIWFNRKNTLGAVKATIKLFNDEKLRRFLGVRYFDVEEITHLAVTKFYHLTEKQFLGTMIHEMIHLYMLQNYTEFTWKGGYHGDEFRKMAGDLSRKSGYRIEETYDTEIEELTARKSSETLTVVAYPYKDKYAIKLFKGIHDPSTLKNADFFPKGPGSKVYHTADSRLSEFSVHRSINFKIRSPSRFNWFVIQKDLFDQAIGPYYRGDL